MRAPFVILTACLLSGNLSAQSPRPAAEGAIAIGITVGGAAFSSAARGTSDEGDPVQFAPYRPTMSGLRIGYGRERLRAALSAEFGSPGISIRGSADEPHGLVLITPGALHLAALGVSLSGPLLRLEGGPMVRPLAGVRVERWTAPGTAARYVGGAFGGLALEIRLARAFAASLEGELGVTPKSPFRREELPEQISQRATWRRSLALSVSWRP